MTLRALAAVVLGEVVLLSEDLLGEEVDLRKPSVVRLLVMDPDLR